MSDYRDRLLGFLNASAPATREALYSGEIGAAASSSPVETAVDALQERFRAELDIVSGEVLDWSGAESLDAPFGDWLRGVFSGGGFTGKRIAFDVDPAWANLGVDLEALVTKAGGTPVRVDGSSGASCLGDVDLGVTVADVAIAETATIAQCARPFRPRALSLVPAAHLVIIPSNRWATGFEDFFAGIGERFSGDWDSYFTWITGPSRTADIEKTLTVGIHGPKQLFAAFVAGSAE